MPIKEQRHLSADGLLTLVVKRVLTTDGPEDWAIGVEPGPSHTHADILANTDELPEDEAVQQYIEHILNDKSILCLTYKHNLLLNAGPLDLTYSSFQEELESQQKYLQPDEHLVFRYWSGEIIQQLHYREQD